MSLEVSPFENGRIKWYSVPKQFGFITSDDGTDIFLHHSAIAYTAGMDCNHGRGFCARALGLVPESLNYGKNTPPKLIERALRGQRVTYRVSEPDRGSALEARAVRRA